MEKFIENFWYTQDSFVKWLFYPLHLLLATLVTIRRLYQIRTFKSVERFKKPIIVVGNISVGGTGKTPFIRSLVRLAKSHGLKVGIVARGYGGNVKCFPHQVKYSDSANLVGDEVCMQFRALSIPIVIDPNRERAARYLIANNDIDIVISDDGLQHYKLYRDFEIVMVDGQRLLGNKLLMPFGPLREPVSRLNSASMIVINGSEDYQASLVKQKALFGRNDLAPPVHLVKLKPLCLVQISTGNEYNIEYLQNNSVVAIAAIGNPQRFFELVSKLTHIEATQSFPDHHAFQSIDFERWLKKKLVMTEKDAIKVKEFASDDWYYLKIEMVLPPDLQQSLLQTFEAIQ